MTAPDVKTDHPKADEESDAAQLPDSPARTLWSFLIFIHLFCVAITLTGNLGISTLQGRLLDLFNPYAKTLHFDVSGIPYHYFHSTEETLDVDHYVTLETAGDESGPTTRSLPDVGYQGGQRRQRYQRLARILGFYADSEEGANTAALIAGGFAGRMLRESGAERGVIRYQQHHLQPLEGVREGNAEQRDPHSSIYDVVGYEADTWFDDQGKTKILKRTAAAQAAPVDSLPVDQQ